MGYAKLTRALMRGGVAERRADGAYRVWRSGNRRRRDLGVMEQRRGDELRANGKLTLLPGEASLYAWAGDVEGPAPPDVPPAAALGAVAKRRPGRSLRVRALEAAGDMRARARLGDAMKRFLSDAECASSGGALTMNWQTLAAGPRGGGPQPSDHLPGYARARAQHRLEQVASAIGCETFQLLGWVIVQEMSAAELARRLNMRPVGVPEYVAGLLRELADAYDNKVDRGHS